MRVWPNPATDVVHVEGAASCEVAVYDMLGQLCKVYYHGSTGLTTTFNTTQLPKGVYSMVITDPVSGERVVRKVAKE